MALALRVLQSAPAWSERLFSLPESARLAALAKLNPADPKDVKRALALYGVRQLLTLDNSNPKIAKGQGKARYRAAVLHLAPSTRAVPFSSRAGDTCTSASDACRAACLNCAGHGGIGLDSAGLNDVQAARVRKTVLLWEGRAFFLAALRAEIAKFERKTRGQRMRPAVRLNGTSDLPWLAREMADAFPRIQFYDYTKHVRPWKRVLGNYHITFSLSETNDAAAMDALNHGINVAAVFRVKKGRPLPASYMGRPVIDGDVHDMRFLDPSDAQGVVVGLRAKGPAKKDRSGFVREP